MTRLALLVACVCGLILCPGADLLANTYYVSAGGVNTNDGLSPATAWQDVDALDGRTFLPGDRILFRRGDVFTGACTLLGSGAGNQVITIGAYGETGAKPHLMGASSEAHIFLLDTGNQYIEFRDLHLSNFNTNNASIPERQVIRVAPPAGSGEINHLYFQHLDVSDVRGYGRPVHEEDHRSYAILLATVNDDLQPTRFNDVRCEGCTFANIDGRCFTINDPSQSLADWRNRGTPYYPSIHCVFQDNYATNVYRNMAMVSGMKGFLMQGNTMDTTVEGSAFWPYNCEGTVVQYNLFMNIFAHDADAYACHFDYNCIDTLMQYNIGVNVEGGLIEVIKAMWNGAFQEGAIARYNIGIDVGWRNHPRNGAGIFLTGDVTDSRIYNNTIIQLSKPQYKAISFSDGWNGPSGWPTNNVICNNIFYAAGTSPTYHENAAFDDLGNVLSHNLYFGAIAPPAEDAVPFTGNPRFANPSGLTAEGFKVTFGSAAISNGLLTAGNGGFDLFGNTVASNSLPTLGFHEYLSDPIIDSDGDAMTDLWESGHGLDPGSPADASGDPDTDRLPNLGEFALGGDPRDHTDVGHVPLASYTDLGGGTNQVVYVYPRRSDWQERGLDYDLGVATNLVTGGWIGSAHSVAGIGPGVFAPGFDAVTNHLSLDEVSNQMYIRLEITAE